MNKRLFSFIGIAFAAVSTFAQSEGSAASRIAKRSYFNQMDIAVTAGTTGLGIDLEMPVGKLVSVRTGFTFVPSIFSDTQMGIQVGEDNVSQAEQNQKFDKMASFVENFLGTKIDRYIQMERKPNFNNFKFLVDVHPLRNKNWFVTGGFYWGPSIIARAENSALDGTSLVGVTMYNKFYDAAKKDMPVYDNVYVDPEIAEKLIRYGRVSVHLGDFKNQYEYEHEYETNYEGKPIVDVNGNPVEKLDDDGNPIIKLDANGNPIVKLDANGKPIHKAYRLVPDENNMVKARLKVNSFRPYIGFGYGGALSKKSDLCRIYVSCGAMFWGGTPKLYTHDGVDLINDVENIGGSIGDNVRFFKKFKFFPVLELRLSHKIF